MNTDGVLSAFEARMEAYFKQLELQAAGILAANRPDELDAALERALAELDTALKHAIAARPHLRLVWSR